MIGWLILAAVLALCAVLCIRAARFKPEAGAGAAPTPVAVDTEGAAQRLAQLCTQGQLEPIHLMDVIEDFVADPCSWP